MPAVISKMKREDLFQEISDVIRQWPELERRIFSQAHYQGQSPEAISKSLKLNVEEVDSILRHCDLRLYSSLRDFRKSSSGKNLSARETTVCSSCQKDLKVAHVPGPGANHILETYRKSA